MVQDYAEMRRAPCLAKLTSLTKEITSGKAREERAPNKTDESALVIQWQPAQKRPGLAKLAGLAEEIAHKRPRPSSLPSP